MTMPARALAEGRGLYMVDEQPMAEPSPSSSGRFVALPYAVLFHESLTRGAIFLYAVLQSHNGKDGCYPSRAALCRECKCQEAALSGWLTELEAANLLRRQRGGGRRASLYRLYPLADVEPMSSEIKDIESLSLRKSKGCPPEKRRAAPPKSEDQLESCNYNHGTRHVPLPTGVGAREAAPVEQPLSKQRATPVPKPKPKEPPCSPEVSKLTDWLYDVQQQARPDGYQRLPELRAGIEFLAYHHGDMQAAMADLEAQRQGRRSALQMRWALANALSREANGAARASPPNGQPTARVKITPGLARAFGVTVDQEGYEVQEAGRKP